ncbi:MULTISPECIES: cupin domain-containing protein [Paraburkholderia]|uniref:cupin domain-containing protein n=1 Tax=Paraburkholderia TaxID=1822464 RepID=UPI002256B22E|nr:MULTISPECIES: cupin domain-containing protein [Paraburkholderia]MCX4160054.1 cupin domain-containing protein [Paraburkholderia megapolitana]MDN7155554.1 cupin domain-containing protein [Paraburkholderia sp. CHISQ3]MDQ6492598.1 cupin domain-containing protein [Paraburkholderia megapolitana]
MQARSPHIISLLAAKPVFESEDGFISAVDASVLPILKCLSIKRIVLNPGAIREPQWNVNANQLAYCASGTVLVSTLGNSASFSSFVVKPGQMYHVESGAIYHIENIGQEPAELIIALRSERPQHFSLHSTFNAMTNAVLGNTYDLPASAFAAFDRSSAKQIVRRQGNAVVPSTTGLPNARLFDVEGQHAPLSYNFGSAHLARKQYWAALEDISMYSLRIKENGMRDVHWHPETAEMGYVEKGSARMRVLDPDGSLDEYELKQGDVYFVPRAYPHHIETLGDDGFHFLIFFDQPTPGDIGCRTSVTAFSREVIGATFGVLERNLPQFPFTPSDPLMVGRLNPRDAAMNA